MPRLKRRSEGTPPSATTNHAELIYSLSSQGDKFFDLHGAALQSYNDLISSYEVSSGSSSRIGQLEDELHFLKKEKAREEGILKGMLWQERERDVVGREIDVVVEERDVAAKERDIIRAGRNEILQTHDRLLDQLSAAIVIPHRRRPSSTSQRLSSPAFPMVYLPIAELPSSFYPFVIRSFRMPGLHAVLSCLSRSKCGRPPLSQGLKLVWPRVLSPEFLFLPGRSYGAISVHTCWPLVNLVKLGSFNPSGMMAPFMFCAKGANPANLVFVPCQVCPATFPVRASTCHRSAAIASCWGAGAAAHPATASLWFWRPMVGSWLPRTGGVWV
ncbi:hypothetical protein LIER_24576 [Lithospermum erythrorhizon]|uniref:Uncharacterized protein n=1 Tax=Lithospermum erythrorhizon TaxID=34254 RepID=A0AAV3R4U0_LITER